MAMLTIDPTDGSVAIGTCPGGCACRLFSPDADAADCGCGSYCVMDTSDWPTPARLADYEAAVDALEVLVGLRTLPKPGVEQVFERIERGREALQRLRGVG